MNDMKTLTRKPAVWVFGVLALIGTDAGYTSS